MTIPPISGQEQYITADGRLTFAGQILFQEIVKLVNRNTTDLRDADGSLIIQGVDGFADLQDRDLRNVRRVEFNGTTENDYIDWLTAGRGLRGFENGIQIFEIGGQNTTFIKGVGDNTTASSANVWVSTTGNLRRSTSSGVYKIARRPVREAVKATGRTTEQDEGSVIDALQPVSFESTHDGDNKARFTGFIAEEVAEVFPEASADDGQNYDIRALVAVLWAEVQNLRKRVG